MAITPFITDQQLTDRIEDALAKGAGGLASPSLWTRNRIPDAVIKGANEIYATLAGRGFSAAQIATWDRGEEMNITLGLYHCIVVGGLTGEFDPTFVSYLKDMRTEFQDVTKPLVMTSSGDSVTPATGPVKVGKMQGTTCWPLPAVSPDRFTMGTIPDKLPPVPPEVQVSLP